MRLALELGHRRFTRLVSSNSSSLTTASRFLRWKPSPLLPVIQTPKNPVRGRTIVVFLGSFSTAPEAVEPENGPQFSGARTIKGALLVITDG